jgi:Exostosin family
MATLVNSENNNKYYVHRSNLGGVTLWDPFDLTAAIVLLEPNLVYYGKVFQLVERRFKNQGWVVYFTWNVDELPCYGRNVIVVLLADEWCRIPKYAGKVKVVFKQYGIYRRLGCNMLSGNIYLNILTLAQFFKAWFYGFRGIFEYQLHQVIDTRKMWLEKSIYEIPLGYFNQGDLPLKEFHERTYDIFFAGSIEHGTYAEGSIKYYLRDPKSIARREMLHEVSKIKEKYPDRNIKISLTNGFLDSMASDSVTYSHHLMNSKICLVPRGTSFETFRFFEAMRYGCIIITESLPPYWFYKNAPVYQIQSWKEMADIYQELVSNPSLMVQKHQESIRWWNEKCSERALGEHISVLLDNKVKVSLLH